MPDATDATDERPPRIDLPPIARAVAFFLVGLLGLHFAATFLWNAPSNPIKDAAIDEVRSYFWPFFQQGWSLFAPNPVHHEDELLARARTTDETSGELRTTEWVSATQFEWTLVQHNPAPSRASRLSSNLHRRLDSAWDRLSGEQRDIVAADYDGMVNWKPLANALIEAQGGQTSSRVATIVRADRVATGYATQVARAMWGDGVVAVQFRLRRTAVPAWEDRLEPEPEDPDRTYRDFGWRPVLVNDYQDDAAFADTFQRLDGVRPVGEAAR